MADLWPLCHFQHLHHAHHQVTDLYPSPLSGVGSGTLQTAKALPIWVLEGERIREKEGLVPFCDLCPVNITPVSLLHPKEVAESLCSLPNICRTNLSAHNSRLPVPALQSPNPSLHIPPPALLPAPRASRPSTQV